MAGGKFIISLDYELMWGVRDTQTLKSYGKNIMGVSQAIDQMLCIFQKFNVNVTFAVVGFLFHENLSKLKNQIPLKTPNYLNPKLSPYPYLDEEMGEAGNLDQCYFNSSTFDKILNFKNHEIATHTYCHYYCMEEGQSILEFEEDLKMAIEVAKNQNIEIKSIVFPRNQSNLDYLTVCLKYGINSYRGNENSIIYKSKSYADETYLLRILRFIDSYVNLTGFHCYNIDDIKVNLPFNIPSSRFLRPYSKKLFFLESMKLARIKNAMTHAAQNNLVYHLWWHPHNFGQDLVENIKLLEKILMHYEILNKKYGFYSVTMESFSSSIKK